MRRTLVTLLAILLFSTTLFARGRYDWERVEKLKPGTPVAVSLWSGSTISGRVTSVSSTALRLNTFYPPDIGTGSPQEFGRANIRRIVHIRRPKLPNPGDWMLTGALIGGGVGLTVGVVRDIHHHENYNWFTGALAGAGLGFFSSCAVLAGVGVVALVHHSTLVYEDKQRR